MPRSLQVTRSFARPGGLRHARAALRPEGRRAGAGAAVRVVDADDPHLDEALAAGKLVVLAVPSDERIGGFLLDGCAVLARDADDDAIEAAARALESGLVATTGEFQAAALRFERLGEARPRPVRQILTPRERQVLACMSEGASNRDIGERLGISSHTAKFHVAQIIAKLGAKSRAAAVAKAMRAGMVDIDSAA